MKKIALAILLFTAMLIFAACSSDGTDYLLERNENLAKLSKVWGFAKYTHYNFISGQIDWDEELLNLIPVIYNCNANDVNGILYDWFVGLGDDGFDFDPFHDFELENYLMIMAEQLASFDDDLFADLLHDYFEFYIFFSSLLYDGNNLDWLSFENMAIEMFPETSIAMSMAQARDVNLRPMADLSWINYDYLGALSMRLLRFNGVINSDRSNAPVFFCPLNGTPDFSNKNLYIDMDYDDIGFRLLGLFRLWNAMKYYFPHLDVLDVDWNELLIEFIPKMLEGNDIESYELTLAAMARHLHDAHVGFVGTTFFADRFGHFVAPVRLIAVEGKLVVYEIVVSECPFVVGDIIISLNGRCIEEITKEMKRYISYPNEEKALTFLAGRVYGGLFHALRSSSRSMEIKVLRGDIEIVLNVNGQTNWERSSPNAAVSHEFLENNIGLINPSNPGDVHEMMMYFANTDGLIIDLRQRPFDNFFLEMRQYLMEEPIPFAYISSPSQTHPGKRINFLINQYFPQSPYAFLYERPVVLLMDERTFSHPEWVIMSFRVAPNVTVMGPFSMGSNGNVASLPLPGGIIMWYTSLGVYTPEGGQTHRIGLTPDIRVDRTIDGIREGSDELINKAIQYIMDGGSNR